MDDKKISIIPAATSFYEGCIYLFGKSIKNIKGHLWYGEGDSLIVQGDRIYALRGNFNNLPGRE